MCDWHSLSTPSSSIAPLVTCVPALVCCIQIDLSENDIDAEGAKAIADALKGNASLTQLDVYVEYNDLGEEGEAVLREATEGRSGFELLL